MKQKLTQFFKQNKKGFTLLELLIVVAILGVLVLIYMPNFGSTKKANGVVMNQQGKAIESAIAIYPSENPGKAEDAYLGANVAAASVTAKDDLRKIITTELGVTLADNAALDTYLNGKGKLLNASELKIKGSAESLKTFFVIVDPGQPGDGAVLSTNVIKDKDGTIYSGAYRTK